jgi:CYTH domain-containing protein
MLEIERTFLVKNIPNLTSIKQTKIKQGYISSPPSPLRIRQKGDIFELTKKIPLKENDYSSNEEINILLTEYEFNKLWTQVEKSLEKSRYCIDIGENLIAELDIFEGGLSGLVFVEVEFPSQEIMESFIPPEWFGKDITQESFSSNSFLAIKTIKQIEELKEIISKNI